MEKAGEERIGCVPFLPAVPLAATHHKDQGELWGW